MKNFKKINVKDKDLSTVQRNIEEFANQFSSAPSLSGKLIKGVLLKFGEKTTLGHGLGRPPVGWDIIYKNNSADIWAEDEDQTRSSTQLVLSTSADVVVNIIIY